MAYLLALDLGIIVGKTISFSIDFSFIPCVGRKHLRSCNGILCFLPFSSVHIIFFIISSNFEVLRTTLPSKSICNNGTSIPWSALILKIKYLVNAESEKIAIATRHWKYTLIYPNSQCDMYCTLICPTYRQFKVPM